MRTSVVPAVSPVRLRLPRVLATVLLGTVAGSPVACDCGAEPVTRIECAFEVSPSGESNTIEFPATAVDDARASTFNIKNVGNVKLGAFSFDFEARNGEHFDVIGGDTFSVDPTEERTLTVEFHPLIENTIASSFTVSHTQVGNAKCPTATVFVRGEGFIEPEVDAGPEDAGPEDAGPEDAGPDDAGVDAGVVDLPDGGVVLGPDAQWFAYGALEDARVDAASVLLDDGTVLLIGGYGEEGEALDTIEHLSPASGRARLATARMAVPRGAPGATLLANGTVAIIGGRSSPIAGFVLTSLEIYDPTTGTITCPEPQDGCGLDALDVGVLAPDGRIDPFVATTATGIVVGLGRTLDDDDNEVPLGGGVSVDVTGDVSSAELGFAATLSARVGEARLIGNDGTVLIVGGRVGNAPTSASLGDILRVDALSGTVSSHGALSSARAEAALALLSSGDVLVAGGHNTAGFGVQTVERITGAFGADPGVEALDIELPVRVGGTLAALPGDILLFTGGTTTRTDDDDALLSRVPQQSADVLVPFASSFLVLAAENGLAQPRYRHHALVVGADGDEVVFIGGTSVSPRRRAHPHVERYVLAENRFVTFGLMGPGAAYEAGLVVDSGAALVSAGGIDPHTGSVSAAVRAFDATNGIFVEAAPMQAPRRDHTLTRTSITDDQTLLVAGGRDETGQVVASLSILDPVNGTDRPLPVSLLTPRALHTATRLEFGNPVGLGAILICGGISAGGAPLDSCEVVLPPPEPLNVATFIDAQVIPVTGRLSAGRVGHSATLLDTGEVLLVGGGDIAVDQVRADLFIPDEDAPFLRTTGLPGLPRRAHAAVLLGSGRVLVLGGEAFVGAVAATRAAELYVRATESFVALPEMEEVRVAPGAFLLADGNVLISGGTRQTPDDEGVPTRSNRRSELYVAGPDGVGTFEELLLADNPLDLSYGRSDVVGIDVFGRALMAGGTHRDGVVFTGDERRTPVTFVDYLQNPADAIDP